MPSAQARAPRGFSLNVRAADFGHTLQAPRRFQIIELLTKLVFAITKHVYQQPYQASDDEVHEN